MNVLCSIVYVVYRCFLDSERFISKIKCFNLTIVTLCWYVPLILSIFAYFLGKIEKNYIIYCWTSGVFDGILSGYSLIIFLIGLVFVIKLKIEVGRAFSNVDDEELNEGFSSRVRQFIFTLIFYIIVFSYDFINTYFLSKVFGPHNLLNYFGCLLENILIPMMCILFGYNKDKWKFLKQLLLCKLIGTADDNEIGLVDQNKSIEEHTEY